MRLLLGAAGIALMTVGLSLLVTGGQFRDVALWLAGAVVLHDLLIAPLVLVIGLLLALLPARGLLRGAFVGAGCLTVIALPVLLAPGTPRNPSVLPLDYPRNWLLSLAAVAAVTGAVLTGRWLSVRWARRNRAGGRR
ncbi:hypothetical protein [Streptomyces xantholiticus]|uniref:hypothetical protein n=1 Tax=Streptomyces xantholiticus TaxID=68285 RepID=UPI001985E3AD|nr:hypothetical protein [Streptomyces xantholiticus]GGW24071.1 hypothetical protein GCM10010381_03680 [Streptomyces xantholiticus]